MREHTCGCSTRSSRCQTAPPQWPRRCVAVCSSESRRRPIPPRRSAPGWAGLVRVAALPVIFAGDPARRNAARRRRSLRLRVRCHRRLRAGRPGAGRSGGHGRCPAGSARSWTSSSSRARILLGRGASRSFATCSSSSRSAPRSCRGRSARRLRRDRRRVRSRSRSPIRGPSRMTSNSCSRRRSHWHG